MGGDYAIFNAACEGYSSAQELLELIRDISALNPKIIIVFNGVIDAIDASSIPSHPFHTKYAKNVLENAFGNNINRYKGMQEVPKKILYGIENTENSGDFYCKNIKLMEAISRTIGADIYCFLQPTLYEEYEGVLTKKEIFEKIYILDEDGYNKKKKETVNQFYENVKSQMKTNSFLVDLSNIFYEEKDIYLDEIHYTEKGHKIIADKVYNSIFNE